MPLAAALGAWTSPLHAMRLGALVALRPVAARPAALRLGRHKFPQQMRGDGKQLHGSRSGETATL